MSANPEVLKQIIFLDKFGTLHNMYVCVNK